MKYIGLRFIFDGGTYMDVAVKDEDAAKIILNHKMGKPDFMDHNQFQPPAQAFTLWSVKTASVVAMHTFPLDQNLKRSPAATTTYVSGVPLN